MIKEEEEATVSLIAPISNSDDFAQSFHVLMLPACCVAPGGPLIAGGCLAFLFSIHTHFFREISFKDLMMFFF